MSYNGDRVIYGVFENGKMLFEGGCMDVAKNYKVSPNTIRSCLSKGDKLKDLYEIRITKKISYYNFRKEQLNKQDNPGSVLDYLYRHLKEYGNTTMKRNPEKYIPKLEELLNKKIRVRECPDVDDPFNYELDMKNGIKKYRRGRKSKYYILEAVTWTTEHSKTS